MNDLKQLAQTARSALERSEGARAAWIEASLELAATLLAARGLLPSNEAFSEWLDENDLTRLSKDDRSALIVIGRHPEMAQHFWEATGSSSWRLTRDRITFLLRSAAISDLCDEAPSPPFCRAGHEEPSQFRQPTNFRLATSDGRYSWTPPPGDDDDPFRDPYPYRKLRSQEREAVQAIAALIDATTPEPPPASRMPVTWDHSRGDWRPVSTRLRNVAAWLNSVADEFAKAEETEIARRLPPSK